MFDNSSGTALTQLSNQNIVDAQNGNSSASGGSYDFTSVDHLTGAGGFFPPGSTGTITTALCTTAPCTSSTSGIAQVTVTINWTGTVPGSYTVSALIISMLHQ